MSGHDERGLLIVAVRVDHSVEARRRIETILAAMGTYDVPPDTEPCAYYVPVTDLTVEDRDHLAHFMGSRAVHRLNVGV